MKKSSTPSKRKRTGSLGTPRNSNSIGLGGRGPFSLGLGRAGRDWELPDMGDIKINAVENWDVAADAWDKAEDAAACAAKNNDQFDDDDDHEPIPRKQQHSFQPNSKPSPEASDPTTMRHPHHSHNQPSMSGQGGGTMIRQDARLRLPRPHPMGGGFGSSATVVTNSTAGSGSTISSLPSIYSGASTGLPTAAYNPAAVVPPAVPTAAAAAPPAPGAVPKAILYQFYGKKPRRKQLSNEDYFAWNNGGRPHELKFTAIFQCPLTGECFSSAPYGDPKYYQMTNVTNNQGQVVPMVWYTKKAFAEHGAAAKCYDCLLYREALMEGDHAVQTLPPMICSDPPYTQSNAPSLPLMPNLIAEKIRTNRERIQLVLGHK